MFAAAFAILLQTCAADGAATTPTIVPTILPAPATTPTTTTTTTTPTTTPAPTTSETAAAPPRVNAIYVIDPTLAGPGKEVGSTVVSVMARTIADEGVEVFTRADARALLERESDLQTLTGDADGLSLAALGEKLGARWVLASVVSAVDGDTLVEARLIDVEKSAVAARRLTRVSEYDGSFTDAVAAAARLAISPLFKGTTASIALTITEEGANVLIDDQQLAVSPVPKGSLSLPGGTHLVVVTKEGFIAWRKTFRVKGGEAFDESVALRPSPDYLASYQAKNGALRIGAWSSTILTVVAAAGGVTALYAWDQANQQTAAIGGELTKATDDVQIDEAEVAALQARQTASKNDAALFGALASGAGAFAVVAAAAAIGLWVFGDDPGRYDEVAVTGP